MTKSVTHDYILHSHLRTYFKLSLALPELIIMSTTSTRRYLRLNEGKRIQIIALREQGYSLREISAMTKVVQRTVHAVLQKWNQLHTIQELPRTGRPAMVDDRTRRR